MEVKKVNYIHYLVVFALCFLFRFVPPIGQITPYGMGILGTFLGAIYGWTTIGMLWTCFMCLTSMGLSIGIDMTVGTAFNSTVVAVIFVYILMAKLDDTGSIS